MINFYAPLTEHKHTLEKSEEAILNGQSKDTGNIGHKAQSKRQTKQKQYNTVC